MRSGLHIKATDGMAFNGAETQLATKQKNILKPCSLSATSQLLYG
jgi:hypothetical protein